MEFSNFRTPDVLINLSLGLQKTIQLTVIRKRGGRMYTNIS